jgi:mannose-6-phosphate isomerase-like protein (cupin superfamily)
MKSALVLSTLFIAAVAPGVIKVGSAEQSADPAIYKTDAELMKALRDKIKATPDEMVTSGIVTDSRYQANIVHRSKPAGAISHPEGSEIHYIIEGSGTMVTGGTFNRTGKTVTIDGGVSRHVAKGDTVVIPAGTPHWYKEVDGSITYLEVRFNVGPKK